MRIDSACKLCKLSEEKEMSFFSPVASKPVAASNIPVCSASPVLFKTHIYYLSRAVIVRRKGRWGKQSGNSIEGLVLELPGLHFGVAWFNSWLCYILLL